MFVRIVKMSFKSDKINDFKAIFENKKEQIRQSKGCLLLELYQDNYNPQVFFTYSYWQTEHDLENYRQSEFLKNLARHKASFNKKPEAWSVTKLHSLL
jgi:Uncharacterized conserved protein